MSSNHCVCWDPASLVKDQNSLETFENLSSIGCLRREDQNSLETFANLSSIGRRSCEIIMEEKTPLSHEVVCFQMLDFETSRSNSIQIIRGEITSFSKTTLLQREPFLTMFYTINSSPIARYQVSCLC